MHLMRRGTAKKAQQFWTLLQAAEDYGVTVAELNMTTGATVEYIRNTLNAWVDSYRARYEIGRLGRKRYYAIDLKTPFPPIVSRHSLALNRQGYMTPANFQAIRRKLDINLAAFGRLVLDPALPGPTLSRRMARFESGRSPINAELAQKIFLIASNPPSERPRSRRSKA